MYGTVQTRICKRLRSPGNDHVAWQNRFLNSLNVYKFGFRARTQKKSLCQILPKIIWYGNPLYLVVTSDRIARTHGNGGTINKKEWKNTMGPVCKREYIGRDPRYFIPPVL
jgi:hypothetical protein